MNDSRKEAIVRDLLVKRPLSDYSNEELFDLNLHSEYDCRRYVTKIFYSGYPSLTSGQKGGLSRKTNRLWRRIYDGYFDVRTRGGRGIYLVSKGYGCDLGHLFAQDKQEAESLAKLLFGCLVDEGSYSNIRITFIRLGSLHELKAFNRKIVDNLKKEIQGAKDSIIHYQERMATRQNRLDALNAVESSILASALTDVQPEKT